jgi:DNA-binding response OmpR family regulator
MSKYILIADDDSGIVEVTKIVLEQAGYHALVASDAASVFKHLETELPSLLLLDIWLAGENGTVLAQKIKKNEKTAHVPIIMISANNNVEKMAHQAGADDFIAKPFDIDELVKLVHKHIHEN